MPPRLAPESYKEKIITRFPSRRDVLAVYGFVVFVVYSWTMLSSLWKLPSWLYSLDAGQIVSVYAYSFVFDFIESVLILLPLLFIAVILPAQFWKINFVANGVLIVVILIASLTAHVYFYFINGTPIAFVSTQKVWLAITALIAIIALWALHKTAWLRNGLRGLADSSLIFLYIYPTLTVVSFFIVAARNLMRF